VDAGLRESRRFQKPREKDVSPAEVFQAPADIDPFGLFDVVTFRQQFDLLDADQNALEEAIAMETDAAFQRGVSSTILTVTPPLGIRPKSNSSSEVLERSAVFKCAMTFAASAFRTG